MNKKKDGFISELPRIPENEFLFTPRFDIEEEERLLEEEDTTNAAFSDDGRHFITEKANQEANY